MTQILLFTETEIAVQQSHVFFALSNYECLQDMDDLYDSLTYQVMEQTNAALENRQLRCMSDEEAVSNVLESIVTDSITKMEAENYEIFYAACYAIMDRLRMIVNSVSNLNKILSLSVEHPGVNVTTVMITYL